MSAIRQWIGEVFQKKTTPAVLFDAANMSIVKVGEYRELEQFSKDPKTDLNCRVLPLPKRAKDAEAALKHATYETPWRQERTHG